MPESAVSHEPPTAPEGKPRAPLGRQIKRGLWVLAVILVVIFVVQNAGAVPLRYLAWGFSFSLGLVVILALALGIVLGWALTAILRHRSRHVRRM